MREISRPDNREQSVSSEFFIARIASRHRLVHVALLYPDHTQLSDAVCHITDPTTHFLVVETRQRWRRRRYRLRHRRNCIVGAPWLWTLNPEAIRLCLHSTAFQYSPNLSNTASPLRRPASYYLRAEKRTRYIAGCWVQFPNGAGYASANVGQFCAALLHFFLCCIFVRFPVKIKSCNLNWSLLIALNLTLWCRNFF